MNLRGQIRSFIETNFVLFDEEQALGDDDSLLETGWIDSTGVLELVTFLESTFDLQLTDEDLVPQNLDSISRIAAFVERKQ